MKYILIFSCFASLIYPVSGALQIEPKEVATLRGPDARLQVVVTRDGADATRSVEYRVEPAGALEVDAAGHVKPLLNGAAKVIAECDGETAVEVDVLVESLEAAPPINFKNQIVPIFTKLGCNGGGCHGKVEGQNGFRLSLLGFEPTEDYEYLVKEARGRRIFPAAPEYSLLLRKATGELPHGGGGRLEKETPAYQKIVRWIEQGMPYGLESDPFVERVEVFPKERMLGAGDSQQLRVTAFYSDGTREDVTRVVSYEANVPEMAECSPDGLVEAGSMTGSVAVMVRFHELVDVARLTVPLGAPVESLPLAKGTLDEHVFVNLKKLGVPPSETCDDPTFLRRVTIDIAGRIPTQEETDAFLADAAEDKRSRKIEELLSGDEYAEYFANKWSALLRNKRPGQTQERGARLFHGWLKESMRDNLPYDKLVAQVVAAKGETGENPAVTWYRNVRDTKEQLQDVAQVFLGIRMQCAQCHHHPYEKWSQNDYYGMEAVFKQVGRKGGDQPGEEVIFHRYGNASAQNPKTGKPVTPTPPGSAPLELTPEDDPRDGFAAWMSDPENPFFAKMLVNRYWKHFFGRGLVEPEDDIRLTNPATHPELLGALSTEFVESGYDLKWLVKAICESSTYQLSSDPNEHNGGDEQNYARFYPRRLPAEVLSDAIDQVTGVPTRFEDQPAETRAVALPDDTATSQSYFLSVFGRPEMNSACECERSGGASLAQTLHLLNSKSIQDKLTSNGGRAAALAGKKDEEMKARIAALYRVALSREPKETEVATAVSYIEKRTAAAEDGEPKTKAGREGFEDVMWALLNTKEFLYNH